MFSPRKVNVATLAAAAGMSAVSTVVAGRLALLLDAPILLAAAFTAPLVAGALSTRVCLVSMAAVLATALALPWPSAGAGHRLGLLLTGAAIAAACGYGRRAAGAQLRQTRSELKKMRTKAGRTRWALSRAGICVIGLNRRMQWIEVNDATWTAFGCDPRVTRSPDRGQAIEDEAAAALMHASSREAWQLLLSVIKADVADFAQRSRSAQNGLLPYATTLYSVTGEARDYRFRVIVNERQELTLIGMPAGAGYDIDHDLITEKWLADVVEALEEPAVVLLSDGLVRAANWQFRRLGGHVGPGMRIFDIPAVTGVGEDTFALSVWGPTTPDPAIVGVRPLPLLRLAATHNAAGMRIVPPGAPHVEAVLLVFSTQKTPALAALVP